MSDHKATPVGGRLMTPTTRVLLFVFMVGAALTVWRFAVGLGPATGLNDGYPWGLWIAFDVVTGTALACGGYAMALLVYIFNKGRYHPLVRPALLTSALGYSVAAVGIIIDVGRPWYIWKIPLKVGSWNLDSALLEVALCVMAYVMVLWIELSPAFLEKWRESGHTGLANFSRGLSKFMDKALIWFIALGLLLPTMHQSSLGSVIMLAGPRLHALWHTPWLPFLYLVSCISMGYAMVVMESTLSSRAFGRQREDRMLASLSGATSFTLFLFVVVRFVDLFLRGRGPLLISEGYYSVMFWLETVLFLAPAVMLAGSRGTARIGNMFRAAMMIVLAGSLYRFDSYLVAFNPGPGWSYFPSVSETVITLGLVAMEIMVFIMLVRSFPILSGTSPMAAHRK
ncbi:MAG: NrfD/PsrC family molybdoenzyme membrane anchor subunit [Candidatus Krumholzibacteriota bacterium]